VFQWNDWWERDPLSYLGPFLEVIRSVETSGPITGMALSTVHRLLSQGFVDKAAPSASAAMHAIADAVAHCRFEETDHDSDEVVLARILQVPPVRPPHVLCTPPPHLHPPAETLTAAAGCVQALLACLRCAAGDLLSDDAVCSIVQACFRIGHHTGKEGELLQQLVRQTMHEMVRHVFGRLLAMAPLGADAVLLPRSPKPSAAVGDGVVEEGAAAAEAEAEAEAEPGGPPYGLPCVLEVFQFLISLVSVEDAGSEDLCVFGLTLINSALEEGGAGFTAHPQVRLLVDSSQ
jgi:brefeldin A-resistance guanine nucleotide exchange factor 1